MLKFVNLTPHNITIYNAQGEKIDVPKSGNVARVETTNKIIDEINSIEIFYTTYTDVEGLPEPEDGVVYIVSGMVASRCSHRSDVMSPGLYIRNDKGVIVGCQGLTATDSYIPDIQF